MAPRRHYQHEEKNVAVPLQDRGRPPPRHHRPVVPYTNARAPTPTYSRGNHADASPPSHLDAPQSRAPPMSQTPRGLGPQRPYQRVASDNSSFDGGSRSTSRQGQANANPFGDQQPRSSSRQHGRTPSDESSLNDRPSEQAWGMSRLLAPSRTQGYRDVTPEQQMRRPASYDSLVQDPFATPGASPRPSYGGDGQYLDTTTGNLIWGQDYSRQSPSPESVPGSPLAQPNPAWAYGGGSGSRSPSPMYGYRSASPVASALHLPGSGYTHSAGAASMSSLSSAPYRSNRDLVHLFPDSPSEIWDREWVKQGYIAKIHKRDDKDEWPNWKRYLFYTVPFLSIATLATYWLYFILRIVFMLDAQKQQNTTYPLAWIFVAVEISIAVPTFLQMFWMVFVLKGRSRPKLRLVGNDVPTVDVFITCCGEDVDVVMDTARAACDVDYPQDRFRVLVLDDANSEELRQSIEDLNVTYPNVAYRSRPKFRGVPHHFKAGNLNYGLEVVDEMPGGASKYMAALDADMIPEQHWLRSIMPHLLQDDKLAMACPPQLFYNVPPGDPLCQSLDFFVNVSEPIKDALGVAWCTGSGYIVRRDALEGINWFPTGSLAEDVCTSTLLLGQGWKCAYIHEPLQFGTVPEDFGSHLKQRTRWAIGTVETSIRLKFCLWGKEIEKMTFYQRMSSIIYAILSLYNIFLTIALFALPIVLLSGNALVAYANIDQLRWLIRACFLALFVNRLCELAMFLPSGYATGQRGARSQIWMAPYITVSILRSFVLPEWLGGQKQAFKPTGSLKSELNERDKHRRAGVWRRFVVIASNYMAGYHLFYVYLVLTAVTLTTTRCVFTNPTPAEKLVCLLTHAFWPPIAWIITISAFWTPITYALDPPTVSDREQLLKRDPKSHVAHPTKQSKKIAFKAQTAIFEMEYFISSAFTAAVFVATFLVGVA